MNGIGGYFELELPFYDNMPNKHLLRVNSGRHALEYILRAIGVENIKILYVPKYTCDVVVESIQRLPDVKWAFYNIDANLEITGIPQLAEGEYIIVNNYFGIKDKYIDLIVEKFPKNVILDNSQALYYPAAKGVKSFYSPRKFVGVPDGGLANIDTRIDSLDVGASWHRCSHLLKRIDVGSEFGYVDFRENSSGLRNEPVRHMSNLTSRMLQGIDFSLVREVRCRNYDILCAGLDVYNLLPTPYSTDIYCPMVYPFRTCNPAIRSRLLANRIFVAKYWPNVLDWCNYGEIEWHLTEEILPLPVDQRYTTDDMNNILELILEN